MNIPNCWDKMTISIPNRDSHFGNNTICPKETLQRSYFVRKGYIITVDNVDMKIVDVRITDDYIFIDLENLERTRAWASK